MTKVLRFVFIAALISLTVGSAFAASGGTSFDVKSVSQNRITAMVTVGQLEYERIPTPAGTYTAIGLPGEGFTNTIGQAKLPAIRRMLEIPHGAQVSVGLTSVTWESTSLRELGLPGRIIPLQPPVRKTPEELPPFAGWPGA